MVSKVETIWILFNYVLVKTPDLVVTRHWQEPQKRRNLTKNGAKGDFERCSLAHLLSQRQGHDLDALDCWRRNALRINQKENNNPTFGRSIIRSVFGTVWRLTSRRSMPIVRIWPKTELPLLPRLRSAMNLRFTRIEVTRIEVRHLDYHPEQCSPTTRQMLSDT